MKVAESDAAGARLESGPPLTVTSGSVTVTFVRVTLPVLVTVKAYVIWSPAFWMPSLFASTYVPVFSRAMDAAPARVCVSSSGSVYGWPP